jgi:hypothetical protein
MEIQLSIQPIDLYGVVILGIPLALYFVMIRNESD